MDIESEKLDLASIFKKNEILENKEKKAVVGGEAECEFYCRSECDDNWYLWDSVRRNAAYGDGNWCECTTIWVDLGLQY